MEEIQNWTGTIDTAEKMSTSREKIIYIGLKVDGM